MADLYLFKPSVKLNYNLLNKVSKNCQIIENEKPYDADEKDKNNVNSHCCDHKSKKYIYDSKMCKILGIGSGPGVGRHQNGKSYPDPDRHLNDADP